MPLTLRDSHLILPRDPDNNASARRSLGGRGMILSFVKAGLDACVLVEINR